MKCYSDFRYDKVYKKMAKEMHKRWPSKNGSWLKEATYVIFPMLADKCHYVAVIVLYPCNLFAAKSVL